MVDHQVRQRRKQGLCLLSALPHGEDRDKEGLFCSPPTQQHIKQCMAMADIKQGFFYFYINGEIKVGRCFITQYFDSESIKVGKISADTHMSIDLMLDGFFLFYPFPRAASKLQRCLIQPEVSISNKN